MKQRSFAQHCAIWLAIGASALGLHAPASAQAKVVWKASDVHPMGYPTVEAIQRMGKSLEAQTNGRISIQIAQCWAKLRCFIAVSFLVY